MAAVSLTGLLAGASRASGEGWGGRRLGSTLQGVLPKRSHCENVILSNAKNLAIDETRPFAEFILSGAEGLKVTAKRFGQHALHISHACK